MRPFSSFSLIPKKFPREISTTNATVQVQTSDTRPQTSGLESNRGRSDLPPFTFEILLSYAEDEKLRPGPKGDARRKHRSGKDVPRRIQPRSVKGGGSPEHLARLPYKEQDRSS
jgi:hypothetical protein